jgi:hypothetical protein
MAKRGGLGGVARPCRAPASRALCVSLLAAPVPPSAFGPRPVARLEDAHTEVAVHRGAWVPAPAACRAPHAPTPCPDHVARWLSTRAPRPVRAPPCPRTAGSRRRREAPHIARRTYKRHRTTPSFAPVHPPSAITATTASSAFRAASNQLEHSSIASTAQRSFPCRFLVPVVPVRAGDAAPVATAAGCRRAQSPAPFPPRLWSQISPWRALEPSPLFPDRGLARDRRNFRPDRR